MSINIVAVSPLNATNAAAMSLLAFVQSVLGRDPTTNELLDPNSKAREATRFWYSYHPSIPELPNPAATQSVIKGPGLDPSLSWTSITSLYDPNSKDYLTEVMNPNVNSEAAGGSNELPIQQGLHDDWVTGQQQSTQRLADMLRIGKPVQFSAVKPLNVNALYAPAPPKAASVMPYVLGGVLVVGLAGLAIYKDWI